MNGRPLAALRVRWESSSLQCKVFAANAVVVFVVAAATLAWTPVTVHRVATPGELVVLGIGVVLMLSFDLLLLRHAFRPLRALAAALVLARKRACSSATSIWSTRRTSSRRSG